MCQDCFEIQLHRVDSMLNHGIVLMRLFRSIDLGKHKNYGPLNIVKTFYKDDTVERTWDLCCEMIVVW